MDVMDDKWIGIEELSSYLDVKSVTIRKWIRDKKIPCHKIGKLWKFKKSEIDRWIESGQSAL